MEDYTPSKKFIEAIMKANAELEAKEQEKEKEIDLLNTLWKDFCDSHCACYEYCEQCEYKQTFENLVKRIKEGSF